MSDKSMYKSAKNCKQQIHYFKLNKNLTISINKRKTDNFYEQTDSINKRW